MTYDEVIQYFSSGLHYYEVSGGDATQITQDRYQTEVGGVTYVAVANPLSLTGFTEITQPAATTTTTTTTV